MKHLLTTIIALLSMALIFNASAQQTSLGDIGLFVGGNRIELLNADEVAKTLEELNRELAKFKEGEFDINSREDREWLAALLKGIEERTVEAKDIPPIFHGIAGFSTALAYESLLALWNNTPLPVSRGKIRDYFFNDDTRSGHLSVDVEIDRFDQNNVLHKREFLRWDVRIHPNTYIVDPRQGDIANPSDPFPGTVPLPPEAINPNDVRSIWARNLDHKLFAKGVKIEVQNVYRKVKTGINETPIERVDNSDGLYVSTEHSCIDIMFAGYPPAVQLPPQIGYCMGRCAHPMIVNSR